MSKKPKEPDEMRMPADKFDDLMRKALGVPAPTEGSQKGNAKKSSQKPVHRG